MLNQIITYWCQLWVSEIFQCRFLIWFSSASMSNMCSNIAIYENLCFHAEKWIFLFHSFMFYEFSSSIYVRQFLTFPSTRLDLCEWSVTSAGVRCHENVFVGLFCAMISHCATEAFKKNEPICSWKFNQLQFVGICFNFNKPRSAVFALVHWNARWKKMELKIPLPGFD